MKIEQLREKSRDELNQELLALLKEQFNLRMQKGTGEAAPKPHLYQKARRQVARIQTLLREKEERS